MQPGLENPTGLGSKHKVQSAMSAMSRDIGKNMKERSHGYVSYVMRIVRMYIDVHSTFVLCQHWITLSFVRFHPTTWGFQKPGIGIETQRTVQPDLFVDWPSEVPKRPDAAAPIRPSFQRPFARLQGFEISVLLDQQTAPPYASICQYDTLWYVSIAFNVRNLKRNGLATEA